MKKQYFLTACFLFAAVQSYAADHPYGDATRLESQERPRAELQARIDKDETPALLHAMQQYRFQHQNRSHIQSMIQEAQQNGLPTEPLMSKVYEGIAKKVKEERIVQAVEQVHARYTKAYQYAAMVTTDKQQAAKIGQIAAQAMTAGLQEKDCEQLMQELRTRTRTMNREEADQLMVQTMTTARIMSRRGVASVTVGEVLGSALQQSYQHREMNTLQHRFIEQAAYGSPEDVARGFSADIGHGANASELGKGSGGTGVFGRSGDGTGSGNGSGSAGSSGGSSGSSGGSGGSSGGSGGSGGSAGGR